LPAQPEPSWKVFQWRKTATWFRLRRQPGCLLDWRVERQSRSAGAAGTGLSVFRRPQDSNPGSAYGGNQVASWTDASSVSPGVPAQRPQDSNAGSAYGGNQVAFWT